MKTKSEYKVALSIVQQVLREWDPYALIAGGAPMDEFESEAAKVMTRIEHIHTPEQAASEVARVFGAAFDAESFTQQSCAEVGAVLFSRLSEAGLLHA